MKRIQTLFLCFILTVFLGGVTPGIQPVFAQAASSPPWWIHTMESLSQLLQQAQGSSMVTKELHDFAGQDNVAGWMIVNLIGLFDRAEYDCNLPGERSPTRSTPSTMNSPYQYQHSVIGQINQTITATYLNPPASTTIAVKDFGVTLGFMPASVMAQTPGGLGFNGLAPLLPLWKAFRNVAYAILAIVMIAIGFMVMLRKKIDPKTVVTVQNALPRIVVALLLITFSYAIVGIMIDAMYLVMLLLISIIRSAAPAETLACATPAEFLNGNIGTVFNYAFGGGFRSIAGLTSLIPNWVQGVVALGTGTLVAALTSFRPANFLAGVAASPLLFVLIICLVLLFIFIRILFMLVDAYVNIIISLLIAPLQLAMEAIPGTNSFGSWFTNLLSKLIVFPITAALLLVGYVITNVGSGNIWSPPLLNTGGAGAGMAGFIGFGILMSIPTIVAMAQKALKAEPVLPGGVGAIMGPVGGAAGQLFQLVYQGSFVASALRHQSAPAGYSDVRAAGQQGLGGIINNGGGSGGGHH